MKLITLFLIVIKLDSCDRNRNNVVGERKLEGVEEKEREAEVKVVRCHKICSKITISRKFCTRRRERGRGYENIGGG